MGSRHRGHRGCAITLAYWLYRSKDTWQLSVSCETHLSPDLLSQPGWLLLNPGGGTTSLVSGNSCSLSALF